MGNLKLFLTPYRYIASDDVQKFFQQHDSPIDYVNAIFEGAFARELKPGLESLVEPLMRGANANWWSRPNPHATDPYDAVRTIGMYEGDREPSLCIELGLVERSHAPDLIKIAAEFGRRFNQGAVQVLFSLKEDADLPNTEFFKTMLETKRAGRAIAKRATYKTPISPSRILNEATASGIKGLTIVISFHQFLYHFRAADREHHNKKWEILMGRLEGAVADEWDALIFEIGSGTECTSSYADWLD